MQSSDAKEVFGLEQAALDRWGKGDPGGLLALYAPEITYFDPITAQRIDGHAAMEEYYRPWVGKIRIDRIEFVNPQVVVNGGMALLTYNLVNYNRDEQGNERVTSRWNSTSVYERRGDAWKQIHSHWSFTKHPAFENLTVESSEQTA